MFYVCSCCGETMAKDVDFCEACITLGNMSDEELHEFALKATEVEDVAGVVLSEEEIQECKVMAKKIVQVYIDEAKYIGAQAIKDLNINKNQAKA